MLFRTLLQRHPACDPDLFRRYYALYRGGKLFRDMKASFLPRNANEDEKVYQQRLANAAYRSYVGPIVDFYASQLFASPYAIRAKRPTDSADDPYRQVDLEAFYTDLKEDADGAGTDLTTFFKGRFTMALVKGVAFWIPKLPRDGGEPARDHAEFVARGLDAARLCPIEAEQVLDWEADEETVDFAWVKIHDRRFVRPSPADERAICRETFWIYWIDRVDTYRIEYEVNKRPKGDVEVPLVDSYPHGFPRVPICELRMPDGLWLVDRAADAQVEHFRLSAALGWSLRRAAYPMGIFKIKDKDDPPRTGAGQGIMIDREEDFFWAEPTGSSMQQLREEIASQKDEIYRVSQQMAQSVDNSAASLGRSGLSKMADSSSAEICLRGYAAFVKEAIEKTYELISDARGDESTKFSVEGMSSFNVVDTTTLVQDATSAKEFGIRSETFGRELECRVAEALLPVDTDQSVKDKIRGEIMTAPAVEAQMPPAKKVPSTGDATSGDANGEENNGASRTSAAPRTAAGGKED